MSGADPRPTRRILVAEDNPINQEVLFAQLQLLGQTADMVSDGQQALQAWREHHHPLVLTDLQMPQMDGFQLAQAIRADEAAQRLPRTAIVALSAIAELDANTVPGSGAMNAHLNKPVLLPTLEAVLARWLPASAGLAGSTNPEAGAHVPARDPAGAATAAEPVDLDAQVLRQYVGDDAAVLRQFLRNFHQRLSATNGELSAAWAAGDRTVLGQLAHRLKSAARTVGALRLADSCHALEAATQAGDPSALAAHWAAVQDAMARANQALTRHFRGDEA